MMSCLRQVPEVASNKRRELVPRDLEDAEAAVSQKNEAVRSQPRSKPPSVAPAPFEPIQPEPSPRRPDNRSFSSRAPVSFVVVVVRPAVHRLRRLSRDWPPAAFLRCSDLTERMLVDKATAMAPCTSPPTSLIVRGGGYHRTWGRRHGSWQGSDTRPRSARSSFRDVAVDVGRVEPLESCDLTFTQSFTPRRSARGSNRVCCRECRHLGFFSTNLSSVWLRVSPLGASL